MNPPFKPGWADLAGKADRYKRIDPKALYVPRVDGVMPEVVQSADGVTDDDEFDLDTDDIPLRVDAMLKRVGIR